MNESCEQSKTHALSHARVVFAGKLATLSREQAESLVRRGGGEPGRRVNGHTTLVVVGMQGWALLPDGSVSRKIEHAENLRKTGGTVEIIGETEFRERVGLRVPESKGTTTFSAQQAADLTGIPADVLYRWHLLGLVRCDGGRYDFLDLLSAQVLAALVRDGVQPERIGESLQKLQQYFPDAGRPLAQLKIVAGNRDTLLVDLGTCRLGPDRQLWFKFDEETPAEPAILSFAPEPVTADQWMQRGRALEDQERYSEAAEAYRHAIGLEPKGPEAYFNLGNVLRELGRLQAAEELYRLALGQDGTMVEAWYNLADVQEEQGLMREAMSSLERAIHLSPAYADAHFNLARLCEKQGDPARAQSHWRIYRTLEPQVS